MRGFDVDRHGSSVRQNCDESTGSSAIELSVGAARPKMLAPGDRVLNTNVPSTPRDCRQGSALVGGHHDVIGGAVAIDVDRDIELVGGRIGQRLTC